MKYNCHDCGLQAESAQPKAKFCPDCRVAQGKKRNFSSMSNIEGISPGTVGALNELRVSEDLMRRGFHVFRALSPSSPCDLIVIDKAGAIHRVEVRTGYTRGESVYLPPDKSPESHDIMAVATVDRLVYIPEWP